jgi:hypothetical protein
MMTPMAIAVNHSDLEMHQMTIAAISKETKVNLKFWFI